MELVNGENVSLLLGYDMKISKVCGDIRYKGEIAGKVIGNDFFINSKCSDIKEIAEECNKLEYEVKEYNRMWRDHNKTK